MMVIAKYIYTRIEKVSEKLQKIHYSFHMLPDITLETAHLMTAHCSEEYRRITKCAFIASVQKELDKRNITLR